MAIVASCRHQAPTRIYVANATIIHKLCTQKAHFLSFLIALDNRFWCWFSSHRKYKLSIFNITTTESNHNLLSVLSARDKYLWLLAIELIKCQFMCLSIYNNLYYVKRLLALWEINYVVDCWQCLPCFSLWCFTIRKCVNLRDLARI